MGKSDRRGLRRSARMLNLHDLEIDYRENTHRERFVKLLQDPVLIVGTVISTATGIVISVKDSDYFGIVVGLFMAILTMQIQLALSERDRLDKQTMYGKIAAVLESETWLRNSALRILLNMRRVGNRFADSPVQSVCNSVFAKAAENFDELSRGYFRLPYGDKAFAIDIVKDVNHTMRAMTVENADAAFWRSGDGRRYFDAMKEALARGVRIERIFIYGDWSGELEAIINEQRDAGMIVHRVHIGRLDRESRVNQHVWDDVAAYATESNASGEPIHNRFTIVKHEVEAIRDRFDRVLAAAQREATTREPSQPPSAPAN